MGKGGLGVLFPQMLIGCTTVLYDAPGLDIDAHLKAFAEIGVTTFCGPPTV